MTKKINILKDESGAVLVIALVMMVVMTMIGIAGSFTSIFETIISGHRIHQCLLLCRQRHSGRGCQCR